MSLRTPLSSADAPAKKRACPRTHKPRSNHSPKPTTRPGVCRTSTPPYTYISVSVYWLFCGGLLVLVILLGWVCLLPPRFARCVLVAVAKCFSRHRYFC